MGKGRDKRKKANEKNSKSKAKEVWMPYGLAFELLLIRTEIACEA